MLSLVTGFTLAGCQGDIIKALKNKYSSKDIKDAIGIVETSKVCSGIIALNKTLKSSEVVLVKLQLAFGIGGKLVYIISGDLSSVENGVKAGEEILNPKDIVNTSIIPYTHEEIVKNLF